MSVDLKFVKNKIFEFLGENNKPNNQGSEENNYRYKQAYEQALIDINEEILQYEQKKHIPKYEIGSMVFLIHQKVQEPFMVLSYSNNSGEFRYEIRSGINALIVCEFEIYDKERDKM